MLSDTVISSNRSGWVWGILQVCVGCMCDCEGVCEKGQLATNQRKPHLGAITSLPDVGLETHVLSHVQVGETTKTVGHRR